MEVLNTKLHPPALMDTVARNRLINRFQENLTKKLTSIVAGAGYGKSTLAADALSRTGLDTVWYRLDRQDADFMVFLTYLNAGVRRVLPDSGEGRKTRIDPLSDRQGLLLGFLAMVESRLTRQTAIVLDDYHLVQASDEINESIEFILDRMPNNLHLIIISRKEIPVRQSALRVRNQLLEIKEADLAFTRAEIKAIFSKRYTLALSREQADLIREKTGGWVASLVLMGYALKGKSQKEITQKVAAFKGSHHHLFSFLEENIFDNQSLEIQDFMLKTALFSVIDPSQCNRVLGIGNSKALLDRMCRDHLMIFRINDSPDLYGYHHLFRDYLAQKLQNRFTLDEINGLHRRIAAAMEPEDVVAALRHFIRGADYAQAVRIIIENEPAFILTGKFRLLDDCLAQIPGSLIRKNPRLTIVRARLHSFYGNPREAIRILKKSLALFREEPSGSHRINCLVDLGSQYYLTGHIREALLLMAEVVDDLDQQSITFVSAMVYLVFLSTVVGDFANAASYNDKARVIISDYPEFQRQAATVMMDISWSYYHFLSGNFRESRDLNQRILKSALAMNLDTCLPLTYYQSSATSCFLADFEQGLDFGIKGLGICRKIAVNDGQKGWLYIACAQNCLGLDRLDEAMVHITAGMEIFEDTGNRWGGASALECMARICFKTKKIDKAKAVLKKAVAMIDSYGLPVTEGILANGMARIHIFENACDSGLSCLEPARPKLENAGFYLFENHLMTARCCYESGFYEKAVRHLNIAVHLSAQKDFFRYLIPEKPWITRLLMYEKLDQSGLLYLNRGFGDPVSPSVSPEMTITLLGKFNLRVGNRKIRSDEWKNSKSLMIFKYLASNRPAGFISREILIELLWPEEDLEKTAKRFNVAMSHLRKVLEPDLKPKAASSYIIRKRDAYRLDPGRNISIDTERFHHQWLIAGKMENKDQKEVLPDLLSAVSWYRGDFLLEDPYEEWCMKIREQLKMVYLKLLNAIVDRCEQKGAYADCVTWAFRILAEAPYDERIYCRLMGFYHALESRVDITRIYEKYQGMIRDMDFPENPRITGLYHELMKNSHAT